MSEQKIGIGIIGAGKAGRNFALALKDSKEARIIDFCTCHERTAREAAQKFGASRWTDDLSGLLRDPEVDAVIVASPDEYHCEQVVDAAQAGKHVLCEKPMCRTVEEADRMIAAAEKNGVVLMVGFTDRFNQPCLEAKKRILVHGRFSPASLCGDGTADFQRPELHRLCRYDL